MRSSTDAPDDGTSPGARRDADRRLRRLLVFLAVGIGVGATGTLLAGDSAWFLAVPACFAVGWLFVVDPQRCLRAASAPEPRHGRSMPRDGAG